MKGLKHVNPISRYHTYDRLNYFFFGLILYDLYYIILSYVALTTLPSTVSASTLTGLTIILYDVFKDNKISVSDIDYANFVYGVMPSFFNTIALAAHTGKP